MDNSWFSSLWIFHPNLFPVIIKRDFSYTSIIKLFLKLQDTKPPGK